MNDDEKLQEGFRKLREHDAKRAPSFERMWRARGKRRSPWAVVVPMASAAAAAAAILVWCRTERLESMPQASAPPRPAAALAIAAPPEPAPLDFLLDVPVVARVPEFDTKLFKGSSR